MGVRYVMRPRQEAEVWELDRSRATPFIKVACMRRVPLEGPANKGRAGAPSETL